MQLMASSSYDGLGKETHISISSSVENDTAKEALLHQRGVLQHILRGQPLSLGCPHPLLEVRGLGPVSLPCLPSCHGVLPCFSIHRVLDHEDKDLSAEAPCHMNTGTPCPGSDTHEYGPLYPGSTC